MKNSIEKRFSRTILAASIAAIGVTTPLAVMADESADEIRELTVPGSQVEVGVGEVSNSSFKYGDYGRGMEKSGSYLIGNIHMNKRGEDNANYLEIIGRNLGLDGSRDIKIIGGEQGNYGLSFEYDELSKLHSDSFQSPYNGMGTTILTQPAGVTDGATTAAIAGLAANMKRFDVETRRQAAALGLTKQLAGGWNLALNYKRDKKDGTKLTGAPIQIGGGGSRGVVLVPEPVDYTTDLFDVSARYADEKKQMQFAYHTSIFDNTNRSLTWDNLYTGTGNTTGRLGQMPDNQYHKLSASGGYTLSKDTRLSGSLSRGIMKQNEAFLPYSTGGTMPATASLNGEIVVTHADIKLNSKLTHDLRLNAGYKFDERDNNTPVNTYNYITADRDAGGTGTATNNLRRMNTPLSKKQHLLFADIDYELSKATKLKFGYDFDKITHTYEPTDGDKEHTLKAEIKHNFNDTASGGLAYAYSDRNSSPYNGMDSLTGTYTSGYLASLCAAPNTFSYNGVTTSCTGAVAATGATFPWLDTPSLRKFFLTDRKRDKLRAFANVAPTEKLDLQFGASYYQEKYPEAEEGFGLAKATGWTANFDANWLVTKKVSGVFFTTVEDSSTDQNSHHNTGGAPTTLDRQNNTAAFDVRTGTIARTDRSLTMGLGFRVKQNDSIDWGGDFTHARTKGIISFAVHPTIAALGIGLPMPDTITRLNRLELFGKYKVQKDVTLNVKYAFEKYKSTDWAWDGQTLTSSTSLVGTGQTSPSYRVHAIGASLTYNFK